MMLNWLARFSASRLKEGDFLPFVNPFRLDRVHRDKPTRIEVQFLESEVRYRYGFLVSAREVIEEWLYFYPKGERLMFSREGSSVKFGPTMRTPEAKSVSQLIGNRPNALFISLLGQFGIPEIDDAHFWLCNRLRVFYGPTLSDSYSKKVLSRAETGEDREAVDEAKFILRLLQLGDTGIRNVRTESVPTEIPDDLRQLVAERMGEDVPSETERISVQFDHGGDDTTESLLDEADESMGTLRLLAFAGPLFDVLKNGLVLFLDELDGHLHPDLVRALVGLFQNPGLNRHGAQIIATTHDASLLDHRVFRPDNFWFTEIDNEGATTLYPLTEYPVRSDTALQKNYFRGRFGGLPALGLSELSFSEE